jgi:hypothetical protein
MCAARRRAQAPKYYNAIETGEKNSRIIASGSGYLSCPNRRLEDRKGDLLFEREEARVQVRNLREKAIRIGRAFQKFGAEIESSPEKVIDITTQDSRGEVGLKHYHPPQVDMLRVSDAFAVADEMRQALRNQRDLEMRAKNLGIE